ncbi:glycosyltransferase family 4 protein [Sanguibacter sp. A247]|uniref:glycosyltransferase family 4 protein n=1 Tax=unclassified Sanguibacter TaxID=2645534 RepID=UPI003FD6F886
MTERDDTGVRGRRVLQVLGTSAGGVVRHVAQISEELRAAGALVRVAGPASVADGLADLPWTDVPIAARPGFGDARAWARLRAVTGSADVVHAHGLRAGAFAVLAARSRVRRPRIVVTLHNRPVGGARVQRVAHVLERIVARGADVVLGVSSDLVASASERGARCTERALVPAPPRATAPGDHAPADQATARARLGLEPSSVVVLTVGRLAPQKGLGTLLDVAGLLVADDAVRGFTWFVAGGGPLEGELARDIAARGLPVRLLGARDDVPQWYAAADVVVSTAVWEGQPIALQEALRAGAPLVVTNAGGTCDVVGDAAIVVPVGDARAIADGVTTVLLDPRRRETLRNAARERAATLPTPVDVLDQLVRLYASTSPAV